MKNISLLITVLLAIVGWEVKANQLTFYPFPASIINDTNSQFYLSRGTYMNGLGLHGGAPIQTANRLNNPTGVEIKPFFVASDLMVVTPGATTNTLWRGALNPANTNYAGQQGQRLYCGGIFVATGTNKITLDGLSTSVIDAKGYLDNQSTLAGLGYSVSRYGIIKGPSGDLFGNDHTIIMSGPGSQPVDAIVFIGARVGADVSQYGQVGIGAVESYIGTGDTFTFEYTYTWTNGSGVSQNEIHSWVVPVYQDGQAPTGFEWSYWNTPRNAHLISLLAPETNMYSASVALSWLADGLPHAGDTNVDWTPVGSISSGWSYEDPSWPTHEAVFVRYKQNAMTPTVHATENSTKVIGVKSNMASKLATNYFQPNN
ncbi:MAG: hypothetical protein KGJ35_02065 [Patescibacteria group bacterium]|nr:hypothetical protein [Patescibacteria group bacterium]